MKKKIEIVGWLVKEKNEFGGWLVYIYFRIGGWLVPEKSEAHPPLTVIAGIALTIIAIFSGKFLGSTDT